MAVISKASVSILQKEKSICLINKWIQLLTVSPGKSPVKRCHFLRVAAHIFAVSVKPFLLLCMLIAL